MSEKIGKEPSTLQPGWNYGKGDVLPSGEGPGKKERNPPPAGRATKKNSPKEKGRPGGGNISSEVCRILTPSPYWAKESIISCR